MQWMALELAGGRFAPDLPENLNPSIKRQYMNKNAMIKKLCYLASVALTAAVVQNASAQSWIYRSERAVERCEN